MKDVLFLSSKMPYPPDDGKRIVTWNTVRCLRENGYAVDLISFAKDAEEVRRCDVELRNAFRATAYAYKDVEKQYPTRLLAALATRKSYFVKKYFDSRFAALVDRHLAERQYDFTIVDHAVMGVYKSTFDNRKGRAGRIVLREHNVEYDILTHMALKQKSWLTRKLCEREAVYFRAFELDLIRRVDSVLAISPRDAAILREAAGSDNVGILPALIDAGRYRPASSAAIEPFSLVIVGAYSWRPNVNGLLWFHREVWPAVVRQFPQAKLWLVGKDPPRELRALAQTNVIVTGSVPDDRPFLEKAHIYIVPLLEGSGVRIKILAAMAMGKTILSTRLGAEGIDYTGILRRDHPDEWIEAIRLAFRDVPPPDGEAAEYVRRHHDWHRTLDLAELSKRPAAVP